MLIYRTKFIGAGLFEFANLNPKPTPVMYFTGFALEERFKEVSQGIDRTPFRQVPYVMVETMIDLKDKYSTLDFVRIGHFIDTPAYRVFIYTPEYSPDRFSWQKWEHRLDPDKFLKGEFNVFDRSAIPDWSKSNEVPQPEPPST